MLGGKERIVSYMINIGSMLFVLLLPDQGSSTFISVITILAISTVWLFGSNFGKSKIAKGINYASIIIVVAFAIITFLLAMHSQIIRDETVPKIYYIQIRPEMFIFGEEKFPYEYFAYGAGGMIVFFETFNLIRILVHKDSNSSWNDKVKTKVN